jgi:hypothetical protein
MNKQLLVAMLIVVSAAVSIPVSAQGDPDPWLGTWKLNVAKSTWNLFQPLPPLVSTWTSLGSDQYKQSQYVVDEKGQKSNPQEVIMRFDGKD